nr:flap endonuclease GEN homolog 1-like [Lytechinus pictus]
MGVPCIQSKGEAEAMCAALNSAGMVDGCMTEDGDVFLYGAQVVYRNLNMATGEVDCYSMDDIRRDLNLDRRRLIALAILLGCDYLPKGVPGVGKEVAMRFMNSLPSSADPLNLFQSWKGGCDSDSQTSEERSVKKKCLRVEGFPNDDVIKEFFQNKEKPSTCHMEWKRPLLLHLMQFNLVKMEWPIGYTQEKVVPLVTLYDLTHLTSDSKGRLHPASIVKLRVRQGVQCVEVKWHKPEEHKENDEDPDTFYTTVEERERFASAHPTMMQDFVVAMETKKVKGRTTSILEPATLPARKPQLANGPNVKLNLFFRVSNFAQTGVKLVFVIDGTHGLKWEEIARRNEARVGGGWRGKIGEEEEEKCLRVEGFPNDDVIRNSFQNKEKPSTCHMEWKDLFYFTNGRLHPCFYCKKLTE